MKKNCRRRRWSLRELWAVWSKEQGDFDVEGNGDDVRMASLLFWPGIGDGED